MATITTPPIQNITLNMNERLNLTCTADGNPAPTITWTRNNEADIIGSGVNLVLPALQSSSGNYTCRASNGVGLPQTATSLVTVKGRSITPFEHFIFL